MTVILLYVAAALVLLIGLAHSMLGERYVLTRLFRRGRLPRLFGGEDFTRNTLRFAWHLTSIAWLGLGAILVLIARDALTADSAGLVIGVVFLVHFAVALVASRGWHFSWVVFLAIGLISVFGTRG